LITKMTEDLSTSTCSAGDDRNCFTSLVDQQISAILQAKADLKMEQTRLEELQVNLLSQEHDLLAKRFLSREANFKHCDLVTLIEIDTFRDFNDELKSLSDSVRKDLEKEWTVMEQNQKELEYERSALRAETYILKNSNSDLGASLCEVEALKRHLKQQIASLGELDECHRPETQSEGVQTNIEQVDNQPEYSTIITEGFQVQSTEQYLVNKSSETDYASDMLSSETQCTSANFVTPGIAEPIKCHFIPSALEILEAYAERTEKRLENLRNATLHEAETITRDAQSRLDDLMLWSEAIVKEHEDSCSCFEDLVTTFRLGDRKTIINYAKDVASDKIKCSINSICHNAWLQMLAKGTLEFISS